MCLHARCSALTNAPIAQSAKTRRHSRAGLGNDITSQNDVSQLQWKLSLRGTWLYCVASQAFKYLSKAAAENRQRPPL